MSAEVMEFRYLLRTGQRLDGGPRYLHCIVDSDYMGPAGIAHAERAFPVETVSTWQIFWGFS